MNIAVLGLGRLGQGIAARLLEKGHAVTVWNRTPGKAEALTAKGATLAPTSVDALADADVVITVLSDDAAMRGICLGEDGIIAHLPDAAVLVDMSTIHPDTSRELAAAARPGCFVDAPVLGSPIAVARGEAKLLLAGDDTVIRRLDSLWHDLAASYVYCGPVGTASLLKLLSNLILVGSTALLAEAVVTAQANGMDDDLLRHFFGESPAVAPGVRVRLDDLLGGEHSGLWTIELARKDIRLAQSTAAEAGVRLPLAHALAELLAKTDAAGFGEQDLGAVVETLRAEKPAPPDAE